MNKSRNIRKVDSGTELEKCECIMLQKDFTLIWCFNTIDLFFFSSLFEMADLKTGDLVFSLPALLLCQ